MWIESISLKNFRGFRGLHLVDLNRRLTVLIGVNGSGKSTIVDALEICGVAAADARFGWNYTKSRQLISERDVTDGAQDTSCRLRYMGNNFGVTWQLKTELIQPAVPKAEIPLLICFPVGRHTLLMPPPRREDGRPVASSARLSVASTQPAFDDTQGGFTSFEFSEQWFRAQEDLENQRRVETKNLDACDPGLEFVRASVHRIVPELSAPRIDRARPVGLGRSQLVFDKGGHVLSADMLSDGEKGLIVLAMTIARRLALMDYGRDTPVERRRATVVIDEVELHLHPQWQRLVVPRLLRAFPNCQFIITTHSPQVIGSVGVENLFTLEDFQQRPASVPTKGRDSNAILEEIMGATARDEQTEEELRQAARLVEIGSHTEAETAVQNLAKQFGEDDREVVRLRTALMLRGA